MYRAVLVVGFLIAVSQCAQGAIINASGSKTAKTSGQARVITNTRGQRQILITIDPAVATAFRLDVVYPSEFVTLAGFDGISPFATDEGVTLVPPYVGGVGGGASILPTFAGPKLGLISDIEGRNSLGVAPPESNRPDGNSDLFTLSFIDLAPDQDKVFMVLGLTDKGIPPDFERAVSDNSLDIFDPATDQVAHYEGDQIEGATIIVPGISAGGGSGAVPLPAGMWMGLSGGAVAALAARRLTIDRQRLTTSA